MLVYYRCLLMHLLSINYYWPFRNTNDGRFTHFVQGVGHPTKKFTLPKRAGQGQQGAETTNDHSQQTARRNSQSVEQLRRDLDDYDQKQRERERERKTIRRVLSSKYTDVYIRDYLCQY